MIGIRTKLAAGAASLVAVLLLFGLVAVEWASRLGGSIDVILRENYVSIRACSRMDDALHRLDRAALLGVSGEDAEAREIVPLETANFDAGLQSELANITLPGEGERAARARALFQQYRTELADALDPALSQDERRMAYDRKLDARAQAISQVIGEIRALNQENMVAAKAKALGEAREARQQAIAFLVAGIAIALLSVLLLGRSILGPLQRLTASAREIESGNLDLVVTEPSRDEMGQLAGAFNQMAGRLRELRRTDQARLLRARQVSQQAIDSLPDAIALFSADGIVELANSAAAQWLGLHPGDGVPASHATWLGPLLARAERSPAPRAQGLDDALQVFLAGREVFLLPRAIPILDERRRLAGVTLVVEDVTERRRIEELKAGVLATVSHELRTPLTSLQMTLHLLQQERIGSLSPEQSDLIETARDDAERLRRIVESLLEQSRVQAAGRFETALIPAREFVEQELAKARPAFEDAGIELSIDALARDLPAFEADPARIGFVLSNLLQNARKHVPRGGRVKVAVKRLDDRLAFSVSDSGPGIPQQYQSRIFERFFQVPGTEARGGVGLGLAICRDIVAAHGGSIHAESSPGHGATFTFELPFRTPRPATVVRP